MATSPSDQNNKNVLAWLDRLQSSIRNAGSQKGPQAFRNLRDFENSEDDSDGESDNRTQAQIYTTAAEDDKDDDNADDNLNAEAKSSLPEAHVPIGLLADLSLSNSNANRKKDKPSKDGAALDEDLNDNNVVRRLATSFFSNLKVDGLVLIIGCCKRNILHAWLVKFSYAFGRSDLTLCHRARHKPWNKGYPD